MKPISTSGLWEKLRDPRRLARRVLDSSLDHALTTAAASVAFFALLAVFPGLAAVISLVGTFADPEAVDGLLDVLSGVIPRDSAEFLNGQITRLIRTQETEEGRRVLTIASIVGFAVLLWSANRGTKALFRALDEIHGEEERRGFVSLTLRTLGFTIAGIFFLVFAVAAIILLPLASAILPGNASLWLDLLRWPVLLVLFAGVLAIFYRFAPNRRSCSWRGIAWGSGIAALVWVGGSILFSWFMTNFGALPEVYGPLSALVGYMVWTWLSVVVVLAGAELDAAVSRADDDTVPAPRQAR